jgi:hypothetical protein
MVVALPIDRWLRGVTLWSSRHHGRMLLLAALVLIAAWGVASRLRIRGDFVELLPSESPTAMRFTSTLERKGGGRSTLLVVVESPDAEANRRLVDALEARIAELPPELLASVERGPTEMRAFFERWRWLFASRRDLMVVACEVERERRRRLGMDLGLDDGSCDDQVAAELPAGERARETKLPVSAEPTDGLTPLTRLRRELDARAAERDRFPTGYYRSEDGGLYALLLRSPSAGMGERGGGDELLRRVQAIVDGVDAVRFHPEARVGLGGDIPNAVAEREALIEDITVVSSVAVALILGVIVLFFRSAWPLVHIGIAVGIGTGVAFATAALAFGHLNAATSFLGSIIVGNGINDSIIYLGRYREQRSRGLDVEAALLEAASSCRRGTWLASVAAGGAYGALMLTSFRGFSEFGLIGAVGMVACWLATFAFCPASITALERLRRSERATVVPMRSGALRWLAAAAERGAPYLIAAAAIVSVAAVWPLGRYLADPWESDFSKLRSSSSTRGGAGHWSARAGEIFRSRGAPDLLLAPSMDRALAVADEVEARDRTLTGGAYVDRVVTVFDHLGGRPDEVAAKLALLSGIREDLDVLLPHLRGEDRGFAERWRPPESLRALSPDDLPALLGEQFSEKDGRVGTPVYVYFDPKLSRSKGENLLRMADVLESVTVAGEVVPNASRATVFAEMIRSMERDGPRATLAALLVVIAVSVMVTRKLAPTLAVVGSLACGVLWTVGGAAWLGVRLNFLNFVALPLTFGIGVEYAINLYDRIRVSGGDIVKGVGSAGGAVFLCSLTTIVGYGALLWADNLALQSFGKYAVAGEIACITTGLLVMPAALALWHRRRARGRSACELSG